MALSSCDRESDTVAGYNGHVRRSEHRQIAVKHDWFWFSHPQTGPICAPLISKIVEASCLSATPCRPWCAPYTVCGGHVSSITALLSQFVELSSRQSRLVGKT